MSNLDVPGLAIQRASERIRQERETFEQRKKHENQWFTLRLIMGFSSIALLASVMVVCSVILLNPTKYSAPVITSAGVALFTDVLGLLIGVWKIVLNPSSITQLQPVTNADPALFTNDVAVLHETAAIPPPAHESRSVTADISNS